MTLQAIRARAALQAGDMQDAPEAVMALNGYINEGLSALCPDGVVGTFQAVATGGAIDLEGMRVAEVLSVTDAKGHARPHAHTGDVLRVSPDGAYAVRALYMPRPLALDCDEPEAPPEHHGALADYATWRTLSSGGRVQQARAEHYHQCFLIAKSRLGRQIDALRGPRRRINQYRQGV